MQIKLSTTGLSPTVTINDLGAVVFTHPTVKFVLYDSTLFKNEFPLRLISLSSDLQNAIDSGDIILEDVDDGLITSVLEVTQYYIPMYSNSAPTVNDDINKGFYEGAIWVKKDTPCKIYECIDNTLGSAIWELKNLQYSYFNGSGIITDSIRGALTLQGGTGNDLDNLIDFRDNLGQLNGWVDGFGDSMFRTVRTPVSNQTNALAPTFTIDFSKSNIIKFTPDSNCVLSFNNAIQGQYTLIVDNTGLYSITLATGVGWYSNLGIQPNMTGRVFISMTYDGSNMYLTELESMNQI